MTTGPLTIGVLGGMGPAATVDFLAKLVESETAKRDQDHVPVVVWSDPRIPDRTLALMSPDQPQPGASLIRGARKLVALGAGVIGIACNTAHHWFDEVQAAVDVPVVHIADAVTGELQRGGLPAGATIGLMCTQGTLRSGFYSRRLRTAGFRLFLPEAELQATIDAAIAAVKGGDLVEGCALAKSAAQSLIGQGVDAVLLACTELPVVLRGADSDKVPFVDATAALARACVDIAVANEAETQCITTC
jgi:aspartate racemase